MLAFMAIGATMHTFDIQLADVDRGVYDELNLRVARHASETDDFMVTRLLAYCLEYEEGIAFSTAGIASTDEPAVLIRDLTGLMTAWIDVGAPDAERLHYANRLAGRTVVYTHRDPEKLLASWEGKTIYRADEIALRSFDNGFVSQISQNIERRNSVTISVSERHIYIDVNGESLSSVLHEYSIG